MLYVVLFKARDSRKATVLCANICQIIADNRALIGTRHGVCTICLQSQILHKIALIHLNQIMARHIQTRYMQIRRRALFENYFFLSLPYSTIDYGISTNLNQPLQVVFLSLTGTIAVHFLLTQILSPPSKCPISRCTCLLSKKFSTWER